MEQKTYKYYDLIMVLFVTVLILSNITSSAKIVDWGISLFGVRLAFDAGTIVISLVISSQRFMATSVREGSSGQDLPVLRFQALFFYMVKVLPGEATWEKYAGQNAYNAILQGMTSGGIVLASLLGYWMGEFSNSFVLAKMKIVTRGKWLWTRTIGSTLVGEGVDTLFLSLLLLFSGFSQLP